MRTPGGSGVPQFGRQFFGAEQTFTRVGSGSLGGKAAGLETIRQQILSGLDPGEFPRFEIVVPTLTVLTTELFDAFMEQNDLYPTALSDRPDERIAHAFQQGVLPAKHVGDLRALIAKVHTPLAVRSSSLLEDALAHPFAGVYGTKMIPNNQIDVDVRFQRLVEAIKFVYASTFFRQAKSYIRSVGQDLTCEKMAVIVQEVIGQRRGDRFYPCISGVGRSYNYYPSGHACPEDGVVNLALGLGKQIVDGGLSWTYSPAYPKAPPPVNNIGDLLKNTQTEFWAVHMGRPPLPDPIRETEYLVHLDLAAAEADGALQHLVSTYDPQSDRLRPGLGAKGPRVLDFAPILSLGVVALNDVLKRLLVLSQHAVGTAVEIEFALNITRRPESPTRLGFLQLRPMMVSEEQVDVTPEELLGKHVVLASEQVLGNGSPQGIRDVVFLKPGEFQAKYTRQIAVELEEVNRAAVEAGRPYLLIGFGRWGSSDPWLGVPVEWGQINGARVIVEASLREMNPDLSQGSHFFHNLISSRVLYLSMKHQGRYKIDWCWLDEQDTVMETRFVRHIRLVSPLEIKVDGRHGRGVVKRNEKAQ
ncbi:MAG: hypothetical protein KAY24_17155 [Candidatus Eisenbacteria sp.]|nr:hypothetical protein [Candidatus Eisenbacteria bacterium]